jgi:hypothetical protein
MRRHQGVLQDSLPRPEAHLRDSDALREDPPEGGARTPGTRNRHRHPGLVFPRAAKYAGPGRRKDGRDALLKRVTVQLQYEPSGLQSGGL